LEELQAVEQPLPAPRSFASLVLSGLAAASPAARAVVTAACVLGEHATVGDVLVIAEIGSVDAVAAFEELTQLGILSLRAGDAEVHFTHPLVRAAVYDDLGPGARCRLHERAARMQSGMAALRHRATATIGSDSVLAADLESEGRAQ
jgi:hypothetical protein